jgi:hypothetical protein
VRRFDGRLERPEHRAVGIEVLRLPDLHLGEARSVVEGAGQRLGFLAQLGESIVLTEAPLC